MQRRHGVTDQRRRPVERSRTGRSWRRAGGSDNGLSDIAVRSGVPLPLVWMQSWSTSTKVTMGIAAFAGICAVDVATANEFATIALYGLLVAAVAWVGGTSVGLLTAGAAAAASSLGFRLGSADVALGVANTAMRWLALATIVLLIRRIAALVVALERYALVDSLTDLPNRRATLDIADREVARARRDGRPLAMVFCDLDNLKEVNDSSGHGAGDELIARFARLTHRRVRGSDTVGRYAGDEFLVLLPNTDATGATKLVRALQSIDDLPRASYGIALLEDESSVDDIIAAADAAMYAAKRTPGRLAVARRTDQAWTTSHATPAPNNPFARPPQLADDR